jgi:membrane protease YdiL (CAAX protease family)
MNPLPRGAPESDAGEHPFWDWLDALFLLGLLIPVALAAIGVTRAFVLVWPGMGRAAQALALMFSGYAFWLTSLWMLLKVRYAQPFWPSMAWTVPWRHAAATIFLGPVLAISVAVGAVLLKTPEFANEIQKLMTDGFSIALVGIFSFTLGPLCEELAFRGFFLPLLTRSLGVHAGVFVCALPFALLHGPQYQWTWQVVALLVAAGMAFGYTRVWTGSTAAATLVHATYNLTFFTGYLVSRKELGF